MVEEVKKMTSEKFCLKWEDFQKNLTVSFSDLRDDTDFCDVTLVSEGNHHIKAHKVILTASSPFFMEVLRSNKHSNPLIYMRGVKANDLDTIVDFLYHGEVNIYQEDLEDFLNLAEELKLKGLTDGGSSTTEGKYTREPDKENALTQPQLRRMKEKQIMETFTPKYSHESSVQCSDAIFETENFIENKFDIVNVNQIDLTNINNKLESMIEKVNGSWSCKICGNNKIRNNKTDYTRHAEIHLEGVSHPCKLCGKLCRSVMQ